MWAFVYYLAVRSLDWFFSGWKYKTTKDIKETNPMMS